ncbi:thiamine kinase-like enzyme [Virgibacillus halotolerans]|uniref:phosphotransferase family protein n=1 Tax=Virgibacillus halotolerans TaxID=1071053 RepID=UPI001961054F|nr:phosphotransferase family protein [Virgibacillus halotolerans]MBM7597651.1 thiamine kinase-like enzyme [Virgibacillus halotolerans]
MVDWLQQVLGNNWKITPAGGLTGDAYIAEKDHERLFLKRNSSPFLAVLSAEGIVPKLIWTRRMYNGDVITAQEWVKGRDLNRADMQHYQVAELLHKIHHSSELLHMLMRLGKKPVTSDDALMMIKERIASSLEIAENSDVRLALTYLDLLLPITREQKLVVCHCDLNHNNLLLTDEGNLFLIDWENAMIADPITDYGMILKWYVPRENWDDWLKEYGVTKDKNLIKRMYWYLLLDTLHYLSWHDERREPFKVIDRLKDLRELNEHMSTLV